ncbi:hypothetical protein ACJ5H2_04955 [Nocardioides sp. R1-1]|uniref:hypothetical protein n=1 Tax=Nocardioides sp. R1-1 TaxID=3383502 RepID=UPI0038CFB983
MRFLVAPAVVLLSLGVTACGEDEPEASGITMNGRIVASADYCGFSEQSIENDQVQLFNESSEVIATGETGTNLLAGFKTQESIPSIAIGIDDPCVLSFKIEEVPDAKFYTVRVGDESSEAWSRKELEKNDFKPETEIGNAVVMVRTREDFCDQMERLNDSLGQPEKIDDDEGQSWDGWLATAQEVALAFQMARVLDGVAEASETEMYDFALKLEAMKYDEWSDVDQLNKAAAAVNAVAPTLLNKYDCDLVWPDHNYVPD